MKSEVLKYLESRGYIYQATDIEKLDQLVSSKKISLYAGFDLTAPSLHIGSLIPIMMMRIFQKFGHHPIILLGGATTKIGDPTGKDQMRKILTDDEIAFNKQGIAKVFSRFLSLNEAIMIDNNEWLSGFGYLDFLRDVGRYFSVNQMLGYESVKQRLEREQNLSFIEFNYMVLQSYDFYHLHKNLGCSLQIGGSDQWGNIIGGVELTRKIFSLSPEKNQGQVFGLTSPLLLNSEGKKMGKTEKGAIWLDEELFSSYDYYQFFRNVTDDKVIEFLKIFTEIDLEEIAKLEKLKDQEINLAKEILAFEATKICHGEAKASKAKEASSKLFQHNLLSDELPNLLLTKEEINSGIPFALLLAKAGLAPSRAEAKRIILGSGGKIDNQVILDPMYLVTEKDFAGTNKLKISSGKKKHAALQIVS